MPGGGGQVKDIQNIFGSGRLSANRRAISPCSDWIAPLYCLSVRGWEWTTSFYYKGSILRGRSPGPWLALRCTWTCVKPSSDIVGSSCDADSRLVAAISISSEDISNASAISFEAVFTKSGSQYLPRPCSARTWRRGNQLSKSLSDERIYLIHLPDQPDFQQTQWRDLKFLGCQEHYGSSDLRWRFLHFH